MLLLFGHSMNFQVIERGQVRDCLRAPVVVLARGVQWPLTRLVNVVEPPIEEPSLGQPLSWRHFEEQLRDLSRPLVQLKMSPWLRLLIY